MLRLKEARKKAGYTQQQVASLVGISQNNYSYWENEKVKIDNLSLQRLASIFGVTTDYLLGTTSTPTTPPASLTDNQRVLLDLFRQVPEDKQALVVQMIKAAVSELNKT